MTEKPKTAAPPDGAPASKPADKDTAGKSKVSEGQDPTISGDAGKGTHREADEPSVDEAGQITREPAPVDLLH